MSVRALHFGPEGAPILRMSTPPTLKSLKKQWKRIDKRAKAVHTAKTPPSGSSLPRELREPKCVGKLNALRKLNDRFKHLVRRQKNKYSKERESAIVHLRGQIILSMNVKRLTISIEELGSYLDNHTVKPKKVKKVKACERLATVDSAQPKKISRREKEEFAANMRKKPTLAERCILPELSPLGFLDQHIVLGFIPDFWHPQKRMIVEIDGGYHTRKLQVEKDRERDDIFRKNGYTVLRFTNDQVLNEMPIVVQKIKTTCQECR